MLCTIGDLDARTPTNTFAVCTFVRVLKPPPTADIIDQYQVEISSAGLHIAEQFLKARAPKDRQAALALIDIGLDDLNATLAGVVADLVRLVVGRILLMLCRHPHILRHPEFRLFSVTAVHCITLPI